MLEQGFSFASLFVKKKSIYGKHISDPHFLLNSCDAKQKRKQKKDAFHQYVFFHNVRPVIMLPNLF